MATRFPACCLPKGSVRARCHSDDANTGRHSPAKAVALGDSMPYFCGGCDMLLGEVRERAPSAPCPKCGVEVLVWYDPGKEFVIRARRSRTTQRPQGGGRWIYQHTSGDSYFGLTGREHYIERSIDRAAGMYHERIIDKISGEVVREVHEPLTQHRGRGGAKARKGEARSPRRGRGDQ